MAAETAYRQVERTISALGSLAPGAWRAAGPLPRAASDNSAGLVFILGFPRAGTTLLAQILASRPDVAVLEEMPLLAKAAADFADHKDGVARLAALADAGITPYREDFWQRARQSGSDTQGRLVIEQTAFNTVYLPLVGRLFPGARIVFAVRDPRDVVFSCFRRQFAPSRLTLEFHSLHSTARFYDATMRLAEVCRRRLGLALFDVRNEDVIADFDGTIARLCAHAGVAWDDSMRDFQQASQDRALATRSAAQIRRGLSREGVGQWRRYRAQMAPVLPLLAPWVEKFGYAAE